MPTFNARLRTHVDKDGKANIKIAVTHKRAIRYLQTSYYIEPRYFDNENGRVKPTHPNAVDLNIELQALELTYNRKMLKLEGRIKDISMEDLLRHLDDTDTLGALDFYSVADKRIEQLKKAGKDSNYKLFEQTLKKVKEYHGRDTLSFVAITPAWLRGFQSWYLANGSQNAAAIYLRNIRAIFNIALNDYNLSQEFYPFRKFKIKTVQTLHRDLTAQEVALLVNYQAETKAEELARDLWLLSFYLCGINFKDLLLAKPSNLKKGRLVYNRAKTTTVYTIKVEPEAEAILKRYKGTSYLLNFMEHKVAVMEKTDRRVALYKDILDQANKTLKKIAVKINKDEKGEFVERIEPQLSTYFARHSWGSIASKSGAAHDVIREALGHGRSVTDIYINFYVPRIDVANRGVIDEVKRFCLPGV